ncbi:MAG TPA: hypothetical protein VIV60_07255, partial [Polyangiaceae bacterium]
MNRAILLGALAMLVGCGGGEDRPAFVTPAQSGGAPGSGGKSSHKAGAAGTLGRAGNAGNSPIAGNMAGNAGKSAGVGGSANAGTAGMAGMVGIAGNGVAGGRASILAPTVKITSPATIIDPNSDGVLKASTGSDSINVNCSIAAANSESPIDVGTVSIELEQNGKVITGKPTGSVPEFHATFAPTEFTSGLVGLRCSATAKGNDGAVGRDAIQTFVDKGPLVTINTPADKSSHSSAGILAISATVQAQKIDSGDTRADAKSVEIRIDGHTVLKTATVDPSGVVVAEPMLNDVALFGNNLPTGSVGLRIIVTNGRGTSVSEEISIFVDQAPPEVTVISPLNNQVVKETGKVSFTVADADSEINLEKLRVRIGSTPNPADSPVYFYSATDSRWYCGPTVASSRKSYTCTFRYNKDDLKQVISEATLFVDVEDIAGNDTSGSANPSTGNILLHLDRVAPFVHLDPPTMRVFHADSANGICSNAFDPVGSFAVGDLSIVSLAPLFRAFVWDAAQTPAATDPAPLVQDHSLSLPAQTDPSSVYVYVQRNTSVPLLIHKFVDNNGDKVDD